MDAGMPGSLADWLKVKLSQSGISSSNLARRLEVHPSTVSRWLARETKPNFGALPKLAEIFAEDPGLLYTLAGYPQSIGLPVDLTAEEAELLAHFRRLSPEQRSIVMAAAKGGFGQA